jgi:hypothetical protein
MNLHNNERKSMTKFEYYLDVAFGDDYKTLAHSLEVLSEKCPSAWVRILRAEGPGGGWPELVITIDESDNEAFCEWYGGEGATPASLLAECDIEPTVI